jgi:hypothetical protein
MGMGIGQVRKSSVGLLFIPKSELQFRSDSDSLAIANWDLGVVG